MLVPLNKQMFYNSLFLTIVNYFLVSKSSLGFFLHATFILSAKVAPCVLEMVLAKYQEMTAQKSQAKANKTANL